MVEKMSNYILDNMLLKNEEVSEEKREVLLFGLTRILEDIPKYIFIFLVCYFLKILPELLVALIATICYKTFIGGAHARTNIECLILSTLYFIIPILISKYITFSNIVLYILYAIIFIFSLYVVLKVAPADTEEVPIINKKIRKRLKIRRNYIFNCYVYCNIYFYKKY